MKVNAQKTQMLCIHDNNNNVIDSYIRTDCRNNDANIRSSGTLKILGFNFSTEPNANFHVTGVIDKLYSKLWTLRFLKKSGLDPARLLEVYENVIRPSAEYSSVIYNSLIPEYLSDCLESVQKQAAKIIFGWNIDYGRLIESGKIETLKCRRDKATLNFALRAEQSPRFGAKWFHESPAADREVRPSTRSKYLEKRCRTERSKNNPVNVLTRVLNEHYRK